MNHGQVIVIGSTHTDKGVCTSEALHQILCKIEPEYIFLEAQPEDYQKVLNGQLEDSLETTTIKKYVNEYTAKHIAVDLNEMPNREKYRKLMNTFNTNSESSRVLGEYNALCEKYGFEYLNSLQADQMQDYINFLESDIVKVINHPEMSVMYDEFKSLTDRRESHWLSVVNEYHAKYNIETSVLLIGAGHRISLREKVLTLKPTNNINWNFEYFR